MSWSGFKKAVNRAGAHVMMKANHVKTTADPEFDKRETCFKQFNALTSELDGEMAQYASQVEELIAAQLTIVKTIDSFYGDYSFGADGDAGAKDGKTNQRDGISLEYLKVLEEIKELVLPELTEPLKTTVLDPIAEIRHYNLEIEQLIKKRGRKKFDYDVLKAKVQELSEKEAATRTTTTANTTDASSKADLTRQMERLDRAKREFAQSEAVYTEMNDRLKSEIDQYLSLRFSLLDPTFESFVRIQLRLYSEIYDKLTSDAIGVDALSTEQQNSDKIDRRLDEILAKMKSLDLMSIA